MDVLFLISVFRMYPGLKMTFEHNSVRKNLFLSACFCWDSTLSLREMDQKFIFGGTIGYGDSYWDSVFRYSKEIRLHQNYTILLEQFDYKPVKDLATATWLVEVQTVVCLVTWLDFFCLYVKFLQPSIVNLIDYWISMSLTVLDIELAEKNVIKELGLFIDGSVQRFSLCPPKTFKPNKQTIWNTSRLHGTAWSSGKLEYEELFAVLYDIKVMNAEVWRVRKMYTVNKTFRTKCGKFGWLWLPKNSRSCWRRKNKQSVDLL